MIRRLHFDNMNLPINKIMINENSCMCENFFDVFVVIVFVIFFVIVTVIVIVIVIAISRV